MTVTLIEARNVGPARAQRLIWSKSLQSDQGHVNCAIEHLIRRHRPGYYPYYCILLPRSTAPYHKIFQHPTFIEFCDPSLHPSLCSVQPRSICSWPCNLVELPLCQSRLSLAFLPFGCRLSPVLSIHPCDFLCPENLQVAGEKPVGVETSLHVLLAVSLVD